MLKTGGFANNIGVKNFLHPSYNFITICIGIIVGTIFTLTRESDFFISPFWIVLVILLLLCIYFHSTYKFIIIALIAGMILASGRVANELVGTKWIKKLEGQIVEIEGTVKTDPELGRRGLKIKLINLKVHQQPTTGSLYVLTNAKKDIQREDKIILSGKMKPGFGVYAGAIYQPKILQIARAVPENWILKIRHWLKKQISYFIPEPEIKLGMAYLLGMRNELPVEIDEKLKVVGLTHIVVASGMHLAILINVARKWFGKISRFAGLFFSVLFILFLMAMIGWTPSILRAGIMSILIIGAWYSGRKFASWRIIIITMAITLLINPLFLIDLGWLLSFSAFGGITILEPRMTQFFYGEKKPGIIGRTILTTISATLLGLPILLYNFGSISLIVVVANLLILPTLPYTMGLMLSSGFFHLPIIGVTIGFFTKKLLDWHLFIINILAEQKMFIVKITPEQNWIFLLYIIILAPFIIGHIRGKMIRLKNKIGENMSGHSKWATTKRQKAITDAKRGALFTKIGNQIAISARSGTDPETNPALAMVLEKARLANMPKVNIERAIARVTDKTSATMIEETYEAYGPGGVGIIIEVATDNKNRTMPEVKHTLDKNGGRMADPGSVMFQFTRKGVIFITNKGEEALMTALESGAEDVLEEVDGMEIYTLSTDLMKVRQNLITAGLNVTSAELQYVPNNTIPVEDSEKLEKLLNAIDDLDDVVAVHTNAV